jgi:putative ABC transport system ATP-binding protein
MGEAKRMIRFCLVSKSFSGKTILESLSGEILPGKIVTVVGPSGSGKSTLLSLCNLLLTPDAGEVYVNGEETRKWNPVQLRRYAGLVFQSPVMFPGTVLDNIEFGPKLRQEKVCDPGQYLQEVGLSVDLLSHEAGSLSGGQKQRVALARVLANEPQVLLLDEVTSALDFSAASEVEDRILEIQGQRNVTVVWVTHHLEQAKRVGDLTWLVANGRLIESGATGDFFSDPKEEITRQFLSGNMKRVN